MLKQLDEKELLLIINNYIKKSDFYKEKFKKNIFYDFSSIPFLKKNEILEDQKMHPPYGNNLCCNKNDIIRLHRTSGTTNKPLLIALTKNDLDIVTDIGGKLFKLTGMNSSDTVFNCLNYNMWMGGFTDHLSMEKTGANVIPFGVGHTDSLIELMMNLDSSSIHCTPSYLKIIKEKLSILNLKPKDLKLKKGFFGAEGGLQNKKFRENIENNWGLEAFNANYGLSEVISMFGSECKNKNGLHFGALDVLYVELIDSDLNNIEIKDGAKGELVVTHLKKESQPLIRYRTGDIIEIISLDNCSCKFNGFKFKITGRVDDMLIINGVNFFPESIRDILSEYPELSGIYKIITTKKEPIEKIKLIVGIHDIKYYNNNLEEKLFKNIKSHLNISIDIEFTDNIKLNGNKIKILERL